MSPTVLRQHGFRFYFFSREERRPHVHVEHESGEAKRWLYPTVHLAVNDGLRPHELATAIRIAEDHIDEIRAAWNTHHGP